MGEVGHAATEQGLNLKEANELILKLLDRYEHIFDSATGNRGVPFDQAYDLDTLTPLPEWTQMYSEVKAEIREMGLAALA